MGFFLLEINPVETQGAIEKKSTNFVMAFSLFWHSLSVSCILHWGYPYETLPLKTNYLMSFNRILTTRPISKLKVLLGRVHQDLMFYHRGNSWVPGTDFLKFQIWQILSNYPWSTSMRHSQTLKTNYLINFIIISNTTRPVFLECCWMGLIKT